MTDLAYASGYADGKRDARLCHTQRQAGRLDPDDYTRLSENYVAALEAKDPSQYERGYKDGVDDFAMEVLGGPSTVN